MLKSELHKEGEEEVGMETEKGTERKRGIETEIFHLSVPSQMAATTEARPVLAEAPW